MEYKRLILLGTITLDLENWSEVLENSVWFEVRCIASDNGEITKASTEGFICGTYQ